MFRRISTAVPFILLLLSGCTSSADWGGLQNPFVKQRSFAATPVPPDFAVIIDENHDTYVNRQHIQQVITAADSMSRTTYTTFRDYNNSISERFTQETPLTAAQIQAMWNDVSRDNLLQGATVWVNWISEADLYKRNVYTVQILANGRTRTYRQTNGFPGSVRPLMLQVNAVRLPMSRDTHTPVVEMPVPPATQPPVPATAPASAPSETLPATQPASASAARS